jgi:hypothetical protein
LAKIEKSIVIEAPVEKVFDFVTDFDNFLKASSPEIKMEVLSRDESPEKVGDIVMVKTEIGDQVRARRIQKDDYEGHV